MHWSVPCCSSDSIVSPLYSQMKEALAHKKWSSRAVHGTCDTNLPTSWFCPEGALSSQQSTNSNMGVASLPHSSATEDGRKIEPTSLDALTLHQWYEWLQLGCRDWLWGLVGFYNNYQKLIFIQSPLTMMCYILKVLLTRDNLFMTFGIWGIILSCIITQNPLSSLSNSKQF